MTDNEIIKALECCKAVGGTCEGCAFGGSRVCIGNLHEKALDLINRQQADKKALIAGQETLQKYIAEQQAEIERLQKENTELDGANMLLTVTLQNAQTDAIKEFAERLKAKFSHMEYTIKTNRKTMPIERVKAEVDAVLQNGCAIVIDKVFKELEGDAE